jgi:hypothetical protein
VHRVVNSVGWSTQWGGQLSGVVNSVGDYVIVEEISHIRASVGNSVFATVREISGEPALVGD